VKRVSGALSRFELTAFVTGFSLMSFELTASRILAPRIGTSFYVWTTVIGVMIAALAMGYAVGGYMADKRVAEMDIALILIMAALTICICLSAYEPTISLLTTTFKDIKLQGICAAIVLFAPASFLMGSLSPYLARLRLEGLKDAGQRIAGLSALNALGSIAGTFLTGFVLFNMIGSEANLALVTAILLVASWLFKPKAQLRFRILLISCIALILALRIGSPPTSKAMQIDTPTAHYTVRDTQRQGRPIRVLEMGPDGYQSGIYLDGSKDLVFQYTQQMARLALAAPHHDNILILGGGAFTLPQYLSDHLPDAQIDVAELDPKLPSISTKYFNYQNPQNVRVFAQDARIFLEYAQSADSRKYDLVLVDVYSDSSVPFSLVTTEYAQALHSVLTGDGVVVANIIGATNDRCVALTSSMDRSYKQSFTQSSYFPLKDAQLQTRQNIIALYSNKDVSWAQGQTVDFEKSGTARTLTDDFAPVEAMHERCSRR
jgi:spermidine synthase